MQNEQPTQIETLGEFMDWVDQYQLGSQKCLFRGLPNQEHNIEASAWRRLTSEQDRDNIDKLLEINDGLIRDARLQGHGSKDGRKLSNFEILAELQHFRAATFLIDFTYSPQVALWFACRQSLKDPQNSEELSDGKVSVVFANPDRIQEVTPEMSKQDISFFFKANADGTYPLYLWKPSELNSRIPPQQSVFLFGGTKTIEPDRQCIILAEDKPAILHSIEGLLQTTETTLFPDFEGFVYQRTQYRPYIPEGYARSRAAGYKAFHRRDHEEAISYFEEVIRLGTTEADIYYTCGESRYFLGKTEEAISDFDKAIELEDDDVNYYISRANAKEALNRYSDAKADLEKALELAEEVGDIDLINGIPIYLLDLSFHIDQDDQWTSDRFKELVPKNIREHYDGRVRDEELYKLGADLQSLIQEKKWKLERRFGRYYFVFRYGNQPTFGVNLFRNPRLAIWGTEEDESKFSECEHRPTYYPPHRQWLFPREATVEELRDIFESIYNDVQSEEQVDRQVELFERE